VTQDEPLRINNRRVDRKLLGRSATQRCLTRECQSWCCTGGVWVDLGEKDRILASAEKIKPFLPADRQEESKWFDGERDSHLDFPSGWGEGTAVVADPTHPAGETCVFLRPEDRRCAIQSASLANGEGPWSLKPYFCILHPLTTDNGELKLDDENEIYIEGGHCQRPNPVEVPYHETFRAELEYALGQDGYQKLVKLAEGPSQSEDR
jgi:hypothetical protein